jgi:hypothetical protein
LWSRPKALHTVTAIPDAHDDAMTEDSNLPERPRLEPEIFPPARSRRGSDWAGDWRPYISTAAGTHRVYVTKLGPFGIALLMLIIGVIAALILLAVLGAILIWIPVFAILLAAGAVFRLLRR